MAPPRLQQLSLTGGLHLLWEENWPKSRDKPLAQQDFGIPPRAEWSPPSEAPSVLALLSGRETALLGRGCVTLSDPGAPVGPSELQSREQKQEGKTQGEWTVCSYILLDLLYNKKIIKLPAKTLPHMTDEGPIRAHVHEETGRPHFFSSEERCEQTSTVKKANMVIKSIQSY